MATATGAYATAALVKARLFAAGVTDTADDALIGTICDQINQYIESPQGCGRVLAPWVIGNGVASDNEIQTITVTGSPTGGTVALSWVGETTGAIAYNASAATVETAFEGLASVGAGNGTVTGDAGGPWTVEFTGDLAGENPDLIVADDALLEGGTTPAVTVAQVSTPQWWTFVLDGNGLRRLYVPVGLRSMHELKIADYTGDTLDVIAATDYFLRPTTVNRKSGWPAEWIELSDRPAGTHRLFTLGYDTVSITATVGWAAIPDDIIDVAVTTAVRAWHARQSGQAEVIGNDDTGAPLVSRYIAPHHWTTIKAYRVRRTAVHG